MAKLTVTRNDKCSWLIAMTFDTSGTTSTCRKLRSSRCSSLDHDFCEVVTHSNAVTPDTGYTTRRSVILRCLSDTIQCACKRASQNAIEYSTRRLLGKTQCTYHAALTITPSIIRKGIVPVDMKPLFHFTICVSGLSRRHASKFVRSQMSEVHAVTRRNILSRGERVFPRFHGMAAARSLSII